MKDMTTGSITKHLYKYAIPLLLSSWFQMGYNAVDSIIVGRFLGKEALSAVGIVSPIINLVILGISGLCIGAGVLMSQFFGAKDYKSLKTQFTTTILSGLIFSLIITILALLNIHHIINIVNVPIQIINITTQYLIIIFLGIPFTFIYNAVSASLKSIGDSKTPLKFLMFTSLFNAAIDFILIGYFGFGIITSAVTTLVAQFLSALFITFYLIKHISIFVPDKHEWIINKDYLRKTIQYGGMTALQQSIQPICKFLIQGQVNLLGIDSIAAFNIVTRIDDFAFTPEQSIAQAITTFIAQNKGANQTERIKQGFKKGMLLEFGYWILIGSITFFLNIPIILLFLDTTNNNIINISSHYLILMSLFYLWPAMTNGIQGFFRGIGQFKITVLGTFIQASIRTIMAYILAPTLGISGIAYSCVIGWSMMLLVQIPLLLKTIKQLP